jgi:hypothetical protein
MWRRSYLLHIRRTFSRLESEPSRVVVVYEGKDKYIEIKRHTVKTTEKLHEMHRAQKSEYASSTDRGAFTENYKNVAINYKECLPT